ncbi:transcription factor CP2-like [Lytechinus pictus]|uniref:transcription factor CP2-like n=1 Tax=Lytechinus pictus TaxID=7653 RepID=UPI00240E86E0|nr:transcription factor CP2-like [Lytechinus pictus]
MMAWSSSALHVDDGLAEDFASNLSGLGTELGTGAYNMSEVLALPMFKQEEIEGRGTDLPTTLEKAFGAFSSIHAAAAAEEEDQSSFQVILNAATSPFTKVNEDTLTYLNQGQSYELKIRRLGAKDFEGKLFKSVVRVLFHDKRLQYTEHAQIDGWKTNRPGERILRIDLPLSYNIVKYNTASQNINEVEFFWDPSSTVGVFLQIHCISSEFTAKKHGGEKGVIFRIQVDSYYVDDDGTEKPLHAASCQVKVFKPKGADRKHKTDREKMEKKTDKHKYQPSYDCTVLTESPVSIPQPSNITGIQNPSPGLSYQNESGRRSFSSLEQCYSPLDNTYSSIEQSFVTSTPNRSPAPSNNHVLSPEVSNAESPSPLYPHYTAAQTQEWLKQHRFDNYCKPFQNFSGADLLRLAKEDLIRILGPADGIRLNNALQERHIRPRLTMYVCQDREQVYHAMYLERPLVSELKAKLAALYHVDSEHISRILKQGVGGIRVLVSDEMVQNITDESNFSLEAVKDPDGNTYTIVMK